MQWRRILAGSAFLCLLAASVIPVLASDFEIKLRSRTFTPAATTAEARSHLASLGRERGHLMLQMMNPDDRWERGRLEDAGVRFLQYLPDNTWIVSAPVDLFTNPIAEAAIRWAAPQIREDRVHPRLHADAPRSWALNTDGSWRLYVRFHRDVEPETAGELLATLGIITTHENPALRSFEVISTPEAMEALARDDRVMWIRETSPPPQEANDGNRANTHSEQVQGAPYMLEGDGVAVGIWDSGTVDDTHPDFFGRLIIADGGGTSDHGTHCAGSIGGDGVNSAPHGGSPFQWRGMAPAATIVSYEWSSPIFEFDEAINTYGISISSNSWISGVGDNNCDDYGDYDFLAPDYDEVITGLYGDPVTVCFAAGNERDDGDCGMSGPPYENYHNIPPPGTAKNTITVGAIHSNNDAMTSFSSWGPMDDGRLKPDIVAPGCQSSGDGGVTSTLPGGGYVSWCGTSMATPTTSGCIAQLNEAHLDSAGSLPLPSLVKAIVISSARDLGREGPDYSYGNGAIDIQAAVDQMQGGHFFVDEISAGEIKFHEFIVAPGTDRLNVALCWSDPAANPGANPALINDLDILLSDPDIVAHEPWVLDPFTPAAPATKGSNHRDNVEVVTVENPTPGTWLARISSSSLPDGPQSYSIAGVMPAPPCHGQIVRVPNDYPTIASAVAAAQECDTILVAANIYNESLLIDKPVVLIGEAGAEETIIKAAIFQRAVTITEDATIDGFTIRDGISFGSFPGGRGGGIFSSSVSPTIRNCIVSACFAEHFGGGIYTLGGTPIIENCVVDSCHANEGGAGIYFDNAIGSSLEGCLLHHNVAGGDGGGLAIISSSMSVRHNTIAHNEAGSSGGGIHLSNIIALSLEANIVASNTAPSGGGIVCDGPEVLACNDVWNNGEDYLNCPAGTDDFSEDPLFCDPADEDYGIPLDSPCAAVNTPGDCGRVGAYDAAECGAIGVETGGVAQVPVRFAIYPAMPNPLTRATRIRFDLPERRDVSLSIFDVAGRLTRSIVSGSLDAGTHSRVWDGRDSGGRTVAAGVYFYRLAAGNDLVTRKLIVLP